MAIIFKPDEKTYTLQTRNTTYQMKVDSYGTLLHLYYGRRVENLNMDYLLLYTDVGFSPNPYDAGTDRAYSLDVLPQEYPSHGVGDFRNTGLQIRHENGSYGTEFRYLTHEILETIYQIPGMPAAYDESGTGQTLIITLKDTVADLTIDLLYGVFEATDMITRGVRVHNQGKERLWVEKVHSLCLDIPFGEWEFIHFHGRHNMERLFERIPIAHGTLSIGSRRGTSSHQHNPAGIICSPDTTEDYGDCYGMALVYSGNYTMDVEQDQMNQVRVTMGISPEQFCYPLAAGETFYGPQVLMTYSDKGLTALSHRFHHFIRHHICRGLYKSGKRPVVLNSWEAAYFDFDEEKIMEIAGQAANHGIAMVVLDDGWFGQRDADDSSLGDWYVNTEKLGGGLGPLVERINALGTKFGIWMEPEMLSEDSDLYRAHPDWAIQIPGRKPARGRMQLVLDMGREDVRDYLYERITEILTSAPIEYVKWDFNRSIADFYSNALPAKRQGEGLHRFVLGIYDLLERLLTRFPEVLIEGCSGGGGRFDAGMLYYTPQIWCSDDTDAIERLEIQYGTSFFYPASAVASHVSACPNHQTGRTTPIHTRGVVAMAGCFGYELDLNQISDDEKEQVRWQVKCFEQYSSLIHNGVYYRLAGPYDNSMLTAWEFAASDGSEALVSIVVTHVRTNWFGINLKLKGLNPEGEYQLEWLKPEGNNGFSGQVYNGAALMYGGVSMPMLTGDYPAAQLYIKAL